MSFHTYKNLPQNNLVLPFCPPSIFTLIFLYKILSYCSYKNNNISTNKHTITRLYIYYITLKQYSFVKNTTNFLNIENLIPYYTYIFTDLICSYKFTSQDKDHNLPLLIAISISTIMFSILGIQPFTYQERKSVQLR